MTWEKGIEEQVGIQNKDRREELTTKVQTKIVFERFWAEGVDFEEIFLPVVKMSSIHVVLGIAISMILKIEQLDVKTAFLHGDSEEEIYMEQLKGFEVKDKGGHDL